MTIATSSPEDNPADFEISPQAFRDQLAKAARDLIGEKTVAVTVIVTDDVGHGRARTRFSHAGTTAAVLSGIVHATKSPRLYLATPSGPAS